MPPLTQAAKLENIGQSTFPRDYLGWILLLFIMGNMVLFGKGQLMMLGMVLVGVYGLNFLKWRDAIPLEIVVFFLWLMWSLLPFIITPHINEGMFKGIFRTEFQIFVMGFAVCGITMHRDSLGTNFLAIIVGSLIMLAMSYFSGDLLAAMDASSKVRTEGITGNSNLFGYVLLLAVAGLLYFWNWRPVGVARVLLLALMGVMLVGILASGSRKAFVGWVVMHVFWLWLCYKKEILKRPVLIILIGLVAALLINVTEFMMDNTFMGARFKKDLVDNRSQLEEQKRVILYEEGFAMIRRSPIFGVGLGNFAAQSKLMVESHSDYIEIATTTGLVGFALYFSIYLILWRRLSRAQRQHKDRKTQYDLGILKAALLTTAVVGFGRPNFKSQITWVFLATAIGYACSLDRERQEAENHLTK